MFVPNPIIEKLLVFLSFAPIHIVFVVIMPLPIKADDNILKCFLESVKSGGNPGNPDGSAIDFTRLYTESRVAKRVIDFTNSEHPGARNIEVFSKTSNQFVLKDKASPSSIE